MSSLRQMRENSSLTQAELAFLINVDPITILRWEQGKTEPSASTVRKLAWALRVEESDVLEAIIGAKQAS